MKRSTKIIGAGVLLGAGMLALGLVHGKRHGEAFARGIDEIAEGAEMEADLDNDAGYGSPNHYRRHKGHRWGHHGRKGYKRKGMRRMFRRLTEMDVNRDGSVTQEEFLAARAAKFARLDVDKSNVLSGDELALPVKERIDWRIKHRIKRFDSNLDGRVTKDEMFVHVRKRFLEHDLDGDGKITDKDLPPNSELSHHREKRKGKRLLNWFRSQTLEKLEKRAEKRFDRIDANGDGVIEQADLMSRKSDRIAFAKRKRLHRFDSDKDGVVSQVEYMARAKDRFALWDLDNNGIISASDLPPRLAYRWQQRSEQKMPRP